MNNTRFLKTTLAVTLFFGAVAVQAADPVSYNIELSAAVPSDAFQVIPVETGWISQTQVMKYDIASSKLKPLEKQFQYKNTSGGIQATLGDDVQLSNGTDIIPLTVSFNGKALSKTAATEVVAKEAAAAGGRTMLKIAQTDDKALAVNGSFTGSLSVTFEPTVVDPNQS